MVRAAALTTIALAAAGCDLVFPPGTLAVDAAPPGDDGPPPIDADDGSGVCGSDGQFDPRRFSEAWSLTPMMSWFDARDECARRGWELATIDSVTEANQLLSVYVGGDHWVGLHDVGGDTWRSLHDCPDPLAWAPGEPDNGAADCAVLSPAVAGMFDRACTGDAGSPPTMICEQPKPPTQQCLASATRTLVGENYMVMGSASYAQARSTCAGFAMQMVVFDTPDEAEFVASLAGGIDYWVGASDALTEGMWLTESGCPGYLPWNFNEPNNSGGTENCASGISGGTINDVNCAGPKEIICEQP